MKLPPLPKHLWDRPSRGLAIAAGADPVFQVPHITRGASVAVPIEPLDIAAYTAPPEFFDASAGLENLTRKALDKADEILDLPLDPADEIAFAPTLRAQTSIVQATLTTQARVDETRFRRREANNLDKLLEALKEERGRMLEARVIG